MIIYKYELEITDEQTVEMHAGAELLDVQIQHSGIGKRQVCLWAVVALDNLMTQRIIRIFGTGNPINGMRGKYVATVQDDQMVWHVFDGGEA